ncbi:MAG TPA: condensation domain-containing protein, partial [Candidatus Dormibacteraeota bacterium]|nr:condensation domain-containing protein [Candidatus Dormibacteraeota bacterium]
EERLRALWARLLANVEVGTGDDFFALGADSLKASQLVGLVREAFGVQAPVSLAYDHPALGAQAAAIDRLRPAPVSGARPPGGSEGLPLSAMQEYFLRWMHEAADVRAVSALTVGVRVRDELDLGALGRALDALLERHEALRSVFGRDGERFVARTLPSSGWPLRVASAGDEAEARRLACEEASRAFDVERGPLCRAVVVRLGPRDHVLVVAVSHLVCDGWSMGVLLRELGLLYSGHRTGLPAALPAPAVRIADLFAAERARWTVTRPFWRRVLDGAPDGFAHVPGRREASRISARSHAFHLPAGVAGRLAGVAREHGVTPFMVVLAVWCAVLRRWTGQADLVLMSPVAGRPRPELEPVVGCLVQSLLLRLDAGGDPAFGDLLARVRATVLGATEHQHFPYEELSRGVRWPGWVRYERWSEPAHFPGLESEPFDLPLELMLEWPLIEGETDRGVPELRLIARLDGSLDGWLIANRHAFEAPVVERLAAAFLDACELACGDPGRRLSAVAR